MHEKKSKELIVIGGAIMDIMGFPNDKLIPYDSTPGKLRMAPGGVGRNIAENLVKLGVPVSLITAFGDDHFSSLMIKKAAAIGLDVSQSLFLKNRQAAIHLAILDHHREMAIGLAGLDIFEELNPENIDHLLPLINTSDFTILETNLPEETIVFLLKNCSGTKFFLDAVSAKMAMKVKGTIGVFHTIKVNRQEAEALTGTSIQTDDELERACGWFLGKGVKQVFLTLGPEGVFYDDGRHSGRLSPVPVSAVNTTGAGDAFMAGLVYAAREKLSIVECALWGVACAQIAILHENAVNPALNESLLQKTRKELKLC